MGHAPDAESQQEFKATIIQNNSKLIGPMIRNSKHLLKYRAQIHIICLWHKMSLSGVHHKRAEGGRQGNVAAYLFQSAKLGEVLSDIILSDGVTEIPQEKP